MYEIIALMIIWFLSGAFSYIYWWTTEYDFTTSEIPVVIIMGFTGILAFGIGWMVQGKKRRAKILIKQRQLS